MSRKYVKITISLFLLSSGFSGEILAGVGLSGCKQDCKNAIGGNVYSDENYGAYLNCERNCEQDTVGRVRTAARIASAYMGGSA